MGHEIEIRERKHRLARELYRGKVSAAFTLCIANRSSAFTEVSIVNTFTNILIEIANRQECIVPVYCFMPDHQHILMSGTSDNSDLWKAIVEYKQKTGYWLSMNSSEIKWQKDFYDHLIRKDENLKVLIRYILDNPVRKNIMQDWREYPYKSSIGCTLEHVLNGII